MGTNEESQDRCPHPKNEIPVAYPAFTQTVDTGLQRLCAVKGIPQHLFCKFQDSGCRPDDRVSNLRIAVCIS